MGVQRIRDGGSDDDDDDDDDDGDDDDDDDDDDNNPVWESLYMTSQGKYNEMTFWVLPAAHVGSTMKNAEIMGYSWGMYGNVFFFCRSKTCHCPCHGLPEATTAGP